MINIKIGEHIISEGRPSFFIAEIGSNFDREYSRAIDLIYLAKECGADAVKFQHYSADSLVSDAGFKSIGANSSHQKEWKGSVYEIYEKASLNAEWTAMLKETCDKAGVVFFTSPYSFDLIDLVDPYVVAYKLGSGDISWIEIAEYMAGKHKPLLIATGASDLYDVERVYKACRSINNEIVLMQCNTNYTAHYENFKHINLNVLRSFKVHFPDTILGLSDHTPGHEAVLGAITLGARVIEKHFTDDKNRKGPDHAFAMDPKEWKAMMTASRNLELCLGDGIKRIEENEKDTVVVQRRSVCVARNIEAGEVLQREDLTFLRPYPDGAYAPYEVDSIIGKTCMDTLSKGCILLKKHLE